MTRVLHVIESLGQGGAERLLVTLLPEMARQGIPSTVLVLRPPYDLRAELVAHGVPVLAAPIRHRWNLIAGARDIARAARDTGADILHAHLYFPAVTTALARRTGLTRARTAVTFHNLAYAPGVNRPGPGLWLRRHLARQLYPRGFDLALGVSAAVAHHYTQALGLTRVEVAPNPVDLTPINPPPRADTLRPRIVLPGRLVPEKGHDILLTATAALAARGIDAELVFAGGGPLAEPLAQTARDLGIAATLTGTLTHPALLAEIASADVVVVPSRAEGFGLVALEAMALGRPVIASDAGGLPEVLGDAGVVVPRGQPAPLADSLAALLADGDSRNALGQRGRSRAAQFGLGPVARSMRARYLALEGAA